MSVSVPNLPLLRGLDDRAGASVAISLQSALLGIDDRSGHASDAQALARALGLSDHVVKLLSQAALRERATARVSRTAFEPVTAQLGRFEAAAATPIVQPPDAPSISTAAAPSAVTSPAATPPKDTPVAAVPVAPSPHPKGGAIPTPATPSPSPQLPAPAAGDPPATVPAPGPGPSEEPVQSPPAQGSTAPAAQDTMAPAIHAHADLVVEATGPGGANVSYTLPSATDAVDGAVSVSCAPASGSGFALGLSTVTCTANDAAHNTAHSTFDVLVDDMTPPTIQAHVDLVAEADGPSGRTVSYTAPAASDSVDGSVSVSCAPASGTAFAFGHTTVTCSAHDAAGNPALTRSFDVNVRDTTAPAIQAHVDLVAEADSPAGGTVSYAAPAASDAVDGAVSVSCAPASGAAFVQGHTTVTCTARDAAHNTAHSSFDVLVDDTTPPTIQAHADVAAEADGPGGRTVSYTAPAASDSVDGAVSVTCAPASGAAFVHGHTTVTCTARDAAHNTAHSSFDVLVDDTTPPTIQAHADLVAEAAGPSGATVTYTPPGANDAVDGAVSVSCAPASDSMFALGHTTVTCSAHDAAGNSAPTRSFDVNVRDTTAPAIQAHADVVAEADGPSGGTVSYTAPAASDSVDGSVSVSCAPASGSTFAFDHTTVTCSAHDAAGNSAPTRSFDVDVRDTTAPAIQAHADVVAEADGPSGGTVSYTAPAASDSVDGSVSVSCAPASGSAFALGHTTVTCTAQDVTLNVAHSTFDVDVRDTTAPVIQMPADITVPEGAPVSFTVTATDAVDGTVPVTCTPESGTTFAVGHTVVTCTAHDAAGNQAASQSLDVFVTTLPSHSDAVHVLLDVAQVMNGLELSQSIQSDLHHQLIDVASSVLDGDAVATCQAFDGFTASANAQLTAGQFAALTPSIDAARTTLGC